jgi:hypothetical protein
LFGTVNGLGGVQGFQQIDFGGSVPSGGFNGVTGAELQSNASNQVNAATTPSAATTQAAPGSSLGAGAGIVPAAGDCSDGQDCTATTGNAPISTIDYANRFLDGKIQ